MSDETKPEDFLKRAIPLGTLIVGLLFVLWALVVGAHETFGSGTFGDAFGPLTGLCTALALCLAFASVHYQALELAATREEMRRQRAEAKQQRETLEKQSHLQEIGLILNVQREVEALSLLVMEYAARCDPDSPDRREAQQRFNVHRHRSSALWQMLNELQPEIFDNIDTSHVDITAYLHKALNLSRRGLRPKPDGTPEES